MIKGIITSITFGVILGTVGMALSFPFGAPYDLTPVNYGLITAISASFGYFAGAYIKTGK